MDFIYSLWFWIGVVAVTAIIAGVITNAVNKSNETRRYVADAANGGTYKQLAEDSATVNAKLLARLDTVETRLAAIEKTLTEIPLMFRDYYGGSPEPEQHPERE